MEYLDIIKRIIKILCVLSILLIINQNKIKSIKYNIRTKKEIENNNSTNYLRIYDNYYIVKSGIEKDVLDNNYVYYLNNSTSDNIFLAGHNSKVVFNILYRLNMSDEVIYHINNRDYVYEVINKEYIDVDDYSIFSKKNFSSLTLITCTYNNQKRYIVICRKKE